MSGLHESHIDNVSSVPRNPMCRRRSVFVVQLDAQACSRATRPRTTNGKHTREKNACFFFSGGRRAQEDAREVRERRRQGAQHGSTEWRMFQQWESEDAGMRCEEGVRRKETTRKHDLRRSSEQDRPEREMSQLLFCSWCTHQVRGRGRGEREELPQDG